MSKDTEHWSSPNGCHPDCPACEAERTPEQQAEYEAWQRRNMAAPDVLNALRKIVALDSDAHPGLMTWQEARREAHAEAVAAIALTEPTP